MSNSPENSPENFFLSERDRWHRSAVVAAGLDPVLSAAIVGGDRILAVARCSELLEGGGWGDVNPNWVLGELTGGLEGFRWR